MTSRWTGLALGVGLLVLGLLTVIKAPTRVGWQLAVLATQYGHWLATGAAALVLFGVRRARRSLAPRWWYGVALLGMLAVVLLFLPALEAWNLARSSSAVMHAAFPTLDVRPPAPWFSWRRLYWSAGPEAAKVETHALASGEGFELSLTACRPARGDDTKRLRPAIVLVHGGGWDGGSRDELGDFNRWLVSLGAVVFAVDYRLAPRWRWPAPRDDVRHALGWVREHATQFGVDPDRVVLFGRSAGAQIALAVAYDPASPPVRGVIAFYGPADVRFAYEYGRENDVLKSPGLLRAYLGGTPAEQAASYEEASPILHVRSDVPATLLVHGQLDTLVWDRQSVRLAARLREVGARHFFLSVPSATHALEFNRNSPGGQLTCAAVAAFLASVAAEPTRH